MLEPDGQKISTLKNEKCFSNEKHLIQTKITGHNHRI